ncbi:hypothetical protein IHE46_09180 [Rhodanobacter sp. DHG33]|nr:hypothetical protein [Rhodanobacter sp. DHG33]
MSRFFAADLFIADEAFFDGLWDALAVLFAVRGNTMAVALATLPLNGEAAGGEGFFSTTGTALTGAAAGWGEAGLPLTGLTTATGLATAFFAGAGLATGLATFFAAGLGAGLATLATFLATFATGRATDFFATGLAAFFIAGFAAFLATGFLAGAFFATGFFAAAFFAIGLDTFLATTFFADTFAPAAFALADVLLPAFPFDALAAVELRVVFAIFLHHFWSWRPGVIAHVPCTGKPASGILAHTTRRQVDPAT